MLVQDRFRRDILRHNDGSESTICYHTLSLSLSLVFSSLRVLQHNSNQFSFQPLSGPRRASDLLPNCQLVNLSPSESATHPPLMDKAGIPRELVGTWKVPQYDKPRIHAFGMAPLRCACLRHALWACTYYLYSFPKFKHELPNAVKLDLGVVIVACNSEETGER